MTSLAIPPLCTMCARRTGPMTCDAFPDGIPWSIFSSDVVHTSPVEGDRGLTAIVDADRLEAWLETRRRILGART
ncbi:MAG: hypothetical protein D6683_04020 [Actinomyces sp.]|nr:MAG: hypothetical protein D6683_04020 [Actinomyces sp.]